VSAEARAVNLLLVHEGLEHEIVLGVDSPHINHLITQRELVVLVDLLNATLHKIRVHRHEPLKLARLAGVDQ